MKNVVMRSFFTPIVNYAQIKRLKYWVFEIGSFEILRWNCNFICFYPSHIHPTSAPSNIESTFRSKKFARKCHSNILLSYPAAEPTTLPFLGSEEVPFDIEYFLLHFWGCVTVNIKNPGNPHKHWIFVFSDFPKNNRIWVLILTHAQKRSFLGTFQYTYQTFLGNFFDT